MHSQQALLGITKSAREWLRYWSSDFSEKEAVTSAGTGANPLAWQLGHIACTQDMVYSLFTGKPGVVPEAVRSLCGTSSPAPTEGTRFPPMAELWGLLERTQANVLQLIETASDADLDKPPVKPHPFFHTLGQSVYTIATNEAYHTGQVGVIRKALGKKPIA
jgi:hypothetical protein